MDRQFGVQLDGVGEPELVGIGAEEAFKPGLIDRRVAGKLGQIGCDDVHHHDGNAEDHRDRGGHGQDPGGAQRPERQGADAFREGGDEIPHQQRYDEGEQQRASDHKQPADKGDADQGQGQYDRKARHCPANPVLPCGHRRMSIPSKVVRSFRQAMQEVRGKVKRGRASSGAWTRCPPEPWGEARARLHGGKGVIYEEGAGPDRLRRVPDHAS